MATQRTSNLPPQDLPRTTTRTTPAPQAPSATTPAEPPRSYRSQADGVGEDDEDIAA